MNQHYFHSNLEAVNLYLALIGCGIKKYINWQRMSIVVLKLFKLLYNHKRGKNLDISMPSFSN